MSNFNESPPPAPPIAMSYMQPTNARPGLVTALAVVSIVLAALVALQSAMMLMHCTVMSLMPPMPVPVPTTNFPTTAPATMPATVTTTSGGTTVTVTTTTTTTKTMSLAPAALTITLMWISNGLNLAMCGLLLWAAIATLKNQRRGRTLHRWWALLKIPLIFLIALAEAMYMSGFMSAIFGMMPNNPPMQSQMASPMRVMFIASGAFTVIFGLVYPITVLYLIRARSVREFFSTSAV